jgi:hypothetical protein
MAKEPPRPYYDRTPILVKAAEKTLGVLVKIGLNGLYIVKRPSDESMRAVEMYKQDK